MVPVQTRPAHYPTESHVARFDGSSSATEDASASIGRGGGKPDPDGYVSVFVNFK
jgi:hypothetical protein